MNITWKEGVTTLASAGAVAVERAYFHNYSWPLVSSTRWVVVGLAALIAVGYIFSYVLDSTRSEGWSLTANILAVAAAVLTALGLAFPASDYVVLLMLAAIVFWVAAVVRHLTVPAPDTRVHA